MGFITGIDSVTDGEDVLTLICVNTICKPTDPMRCCKSCGVHAGDCEPCGSNDTFCTRCSNPLIAFTDSDLKGNIARGEEALKNIESGAVFEIGELFGGQ